MTGSLGQPVIIENVSGANGTIGVGRAARAAYTICVGLWGTHVVNGAIYSLRYDLRTDFEPISLIVGNPQMIFGKKGIPAKDLKELIAWLKANPDKASQGTTTAGTHALGAFFQKETGTRFQFVPYRGEALGVTDLLAGQVQVMFGSATSSMPYIRAGALRPLAVTTAVRWEGLPDVPAVAEFVPDYEASAWHGIGVPKDTPADIVDRLNREINAALADPKMKARLADVAYTSVPMTLADFEKFIADEAEKWGKVASISAAVHRTSMVMLRPTAQPTSCRPCRNAASRFCPSGSSAAKSINTPMRRMRSRCCACAASGHATTAPPSSVMNSRRRITQSPHQRGRAVPAIRRGRAPWRS
jgi:tripartite-type tricarboxylate transporter receptor subunit TctC